MKTMTLQHIGRDSWSRPVYESEGRIYVDIHPLTQDTPPAIHTKSSNAFDGEPDCPVRNTEFVFVPGRDTWQNPLNKN